MHNGSGNALRIIFVVQLSYNYTYSLQIITVPSNMSEFFFCFIRILWFNHTRNLYSRQPKIYTGSRLQYPWASTGFLFSKYVSRKFKLVAPIRKIYTLLFSTSSIYIYIFEYGLTLWNRSTISNYVMLDWAQRKFPRFDLHTLNIHFPPHDYAPVFQYCLIFLTRQTSGFLRVFPSYQIIIFLSDTQILYSLSLFNQLTIS